MAARPDVHLRRSGLASEAIPGPYFLKGAHERDHANGRTATARELHGKQVSGPPLSEAEHFRKCPLCGGYVDPRDRVWLKEHQQPLPHPAMNRTQ